MTRHTDDRINKLLRDWSLRGDLVATKASYEAQDFDALMLFFRDAHRGHSITNFSQRMHHVIHAKTGMVMPIDLADTLKNLWFVRPGAGEIRYVAAASRYTYGRPVNRAWFERMKALELDDIHAFLDARKAPLPNRSSIHVLIDAIRDQVDPRYIGGLPLSPADQGGGFTNADILMLWDKDVPAKYASAMRTSAGPDGAYPQYSVFDILMLHEAGVSAEYAAALNRHCSTSNVLRFYREGIPPEFAMEMA